MKCYILEENQFFNIKKKKREENNCEMEKVINELCEKWQVRNLSQTGSSLYDDDGIESKKLYECLEPENFVILNNEVIGYYSDHFGEVGYLPFIIKDNKIRIGSYDYSDYRNGTGKVDRGFIDIVPRPDLDTNPYYDQPRFHSQEEYDDYIKWRDWFLINVF